MKTLGLDISTSITGLAVAEYDKIIYIDIILLDDIPNYLDKFIYVDAYLQDFFDKWVDIDKINIENFAMQHRQTTVETIVKLSSLNNFITYECYKKTGIIPNKPNVRAARKKVWGKIPSEVDSKLYVGEQVLKIYPNIIEDVNNIVMKKYPQMICTRGENKGKILKQYEMCWLDASDAITMALSK